MLGICGSESVGAVVCSGIQFVQFVIRQALGAEVPGAKGKAAQQQDGERRDYQCPANGTRPAFGE